MVVALLIFLCGNILWGMQPDPGYDGDDERDKIVLPLSLLQEDQPDSNKISKNSDSSSTDSSSTEHKRALVRRAHKIQNQKSALLFNKKADFFFKKIDENIDYIFSIIKNRDTPSLYYEKIQEYYLILSRIYDHLNFLYMKNDSNKFMDEMVDMKLSGHWKYYELAIEHYCDHINTYRSYDDMDILYGL